MTEPILAGIETEYGLQIEGRSPDDQVDDAYEFVRAYPGPCWEGWDYRHESPRADLRGFRVDRLKVDPEDAKFDAGRRHGADREVRADRILANGARFYNDHGHPEYATPECFTLDELVRQDAAGEQAVLSAARRYRKETGRRARVYKNNTDFHGASYGTHESYLVPRDLGFERIFEAVLPMLVARQVLCGAGKVGSELGRACVYQMSQRADFFVEPASVETLYRRPVFNTRDEPHADPARWIRLHVICGDANRLASATKRKVGLVKLALTLAQHGIAPPWKIADPVFSFQAVSRDESYRFPVDLRGGDSSSAEAILESYFEAADGLEEPDSDLLWTSRTSRELLRELKSDWNRFRRHADWAAKRSMIETFLVAEGVDWTDSRLQSFDLEYANLDPEEGLFSALVEMGEVEPGVSAAIAAAALDEPPCDSTRAQARALAVTRFGDALRDASWGSLTFEIDSRREVVDLPPDLRPSPELAEIQDVVSFIKRLRGDK